MAVGVKLNSASGLSGTVAVFDIHRKNVAVAGPAVPFNSIQTGERRSRGFDADPGFQPTPGLSVLLNHANLDAQVIKDGSPLVACRDPDRRAGGGRSGARTGGGVVVGLKRGFCSMAVVRDDVARRMPIDAGRSDINGIRS